MGVLGNSTGCMKPSTVRERILRERDDIQCLLDALERNARRQNGHADTGADAIRRQCEALRDRILRYAALERAILVPALREADAWGEVRARRLANHLRERRANLDELVKLDGVESRPLAQGVARLVAYVRRAMHGEEHLLDPDLLRDDVMGIDVHTG